MDRNASSTPRLYQVYLDDERRALWLYEETGRMEWQPGAETPDRHMVYED